MTISFRNSSLRSRSMSVAPRLKSGAASDFKSVYLPLVRPFSAVPALLQRMRANGIKLAVASSAKKDELDVYLQIAEVADIFDAIVSSEDVQTPSRHPMS